ncbi:hypothetical protein ACFX15_012877 [Malus domestica]
MGTSLKLLFPTDAKLPIHLVNAIKFQSFSSQSNPNNKETKNKEPSLEIQTYRVMGMLQKVGAGLLEVCSTMARSLEAEMGQRRISEWQEIRVVVMEERRVVLVGLERKLWSE